MKPGMQPGLLRAITAVALWYGTSNPSQHRTGMKEFDRKFGKDFLPGLPTSPGVYLFKDEQGEILYAGKAKNIRRRLSAYRNATNRKIHRKMKMIVRESSTVDIQLQPSEHTALLVENQLIRTHRPPFNVDGAYHFLYPAIGLATDEHRLLLCFTTDLAPWTSLSLDFYGVFRSRLRALGAFESLTDLLSIIGHRDKKSNLPPHPQIRGSRFVGIRRVQQLAPSLRELLSGHSDVPPALIERLLGHRSARKNAAAVEVHLRTLSSFTHQDLIPLQTALLESGRSGHFIGQEERDALFVTHRYTNSR